ncbi:MAG: hypothetical protein H2052_03735 [Sphingosinicella sp.]|nr:hypothetical protein [Sphingosinicella sp.]
MNARQQGVAMSEVLATIQTDDPDLKSLLRTLIVAAYEKPRFLTDENRENAVADFRNETELACWKGTP